MLTAYPTRIYADATSLIVFEGPANVAVSWSILSGPGTVEPLTGYTDSRGLAGALYRASGVVGTPVIRVQHGA